MAGFYFYGLFIKDFLQETTQDTDFSPFFFLRCLSQFATIFTFV